MMTLFKRILKFLRERDCLNEIGVNSQANGPLYLKEFLPMSRLYMGRTKSQIKEVLRYLFINTEGVNFTRYLLAATLLMQY